MANRNLNHCWVYQKMLTKLTGKLVLASGGAISSTAGIGFAAVKAGTGLYTLTLDDQFVDVQGFDAWLVETTATALIVKPLVNYTTVLTQKLGTCQIQIVNTSATATDVSQTCELHFELSLKNTSVPR